MGRQLNWGAAIATQCGVVPLLVGPPGSAKSAYWMCLAAVARRRYMQLILRQCMPEDIGGIPQRATRVIDGIEYEVVIKILMEEVARARLEPTLLLLDELNHAGHDVLGAAQEWINNPPPNCWMVAAMNPVEQSTSGVELSAPVINRMAQFVWETPIDEIHAGWESGFKNYPAPTVPIVPTDYLDQFGPLWGKLLKEYSLAFPDQFDDRAFPKDVSKASSPWPSFRSWTNCGKIMAGCDAVGANSVVRGNCIAGCVGSEAAIHFQQWIGKQDIPDPRELLADPSKLNLHRRYDIAQALINRIIGVVKADNDGETFEKAMDVVGVALEQNEGVGWVALQGVNAARPAGYHPRSRNGVFSRAMKSIEDARAAANGVAVQAVGVPA